VRVYVCAYGQNIDMQEMIVSCLNNGLQLAANNPTSCTPVTYR